MAVAGPVSIELKVGNLADERADVLVSAANTVMAMDVGVARALRDRAGDKLARAVKSARDLRMGDVFWTDAFRLDAKWVAHAVAAYRGAVCIQRTVLRTLLEAEVRRVRSIAFPALGGGVGGVPMALVAERTLQAIRTFATLDPESVREVRIVLYSEPIRSIWAEILHSL
jgi:O-acetyl-ADP-ribose deacetylase (regulator of RNase III)